MVKDKTEKKYIVVTYSPDVYRVKSILQPDNEGLEKLRYTVENLNGEVLQTQQKMNNPDKERRARRLFATDLLLVKKTSDESPIVNTGITTKQAHKLNGVRFENNENLPVPPTVNVNPIRPPPQTIIPVARPQRERRTPSHLNIYDV